MRLFARKHDGFLCYLIVFLGQHSRMFATHPFTCPEWTGPAVTGRFTSEDGTICYLHVAESVSWHDANRICFKHGWMLVKVSTQKIYDLVHEYMMSRPRQCFWIGLSDHIEEGTFQWVDGSPVTFQKFDSGIWGFFQKFIIDCVAFCLDIGSQDYYWRLKHCSDQLIRWEFLCQADATIVTTPAGTVSSESDRGRQLVTRKPTYPRFVKKTDAIGFKLTARADFSVKCGKAVFCARRCQQHKTCVLFNFRPSTRTCNGYSSRDQERKCQDGWEIWIKLE